MSKTFNQSYTDTISFGVDVNTNAHKFKRHFFSKFLIDSEHLKYRCLNYDETHINEMNSRKKSWSDRGKS